ncbi:ACP S-malonyltransferase [Chitinophaga sp. GbtcB8]|uniref:ACP S-malonyltransferase n=1 Tax=Chitinophaga sp. GbtcB8 TaxID=2824753 RepID=UPI001C3005DE|nr:ACP S-malonyltransferase [Chitinophaga sp. GbtcB8]
MKRIAVIFPGQGIDIRESEELVRKHTVARRIFAEAGSLLGRDLLEVSAAPTPATSDQVRIVLSSVANFECFVRDRRLLPAVHYMAGHSLGEYSALICAGALKLSDAVRLLAHRQRLMDDCARTAGGGMAVVQGLTQDQVTKELSLLQRQGKAIGISAFNTPRQFAISGHIGTIKEMGVLVAKLGGIFMQLKVNGPLHSELMSNAANEFRSYVEATGFDQPNCTVYSSITGNPLYDSREIKNNLVSQLTQPVLWEHVLQALVRRKVTLFINAGPGSTLEKMMGSSWPGCSAFSLGREDTRNACAAYINAEIDTYVSPVTRCLVSAVAARNNTLSQEVGDIVKVYDRIWEIQLSVEKEKRSADRATVLAALSDLKYILEKKGLEDDQVSAKVDQLIFETGMKCLYPE